MKYKITQKQHTFPDGEEYFFLSVDILDENNERIEELSSNVDTLISVEYLSYYYLEKGINQEDGYPTDDEGSTLHDTGSGVYWRIYSDRTLIWNRIDEEDNLPVEKTWIDNNKLLSIGKKYYEVKKTYVKDEGYLGVTDEIFVI
ncbi:hypothetical protein HCJ66_04280 [Listeria sp. FSL L7-1582]|uniref:hypothetical protein n=1 Tax=Listeria portnoyi TaxID=2713504 RepID=UPI00164D1C73|nr:hypothetical protein [Listeria portnoyi]MBC6308769.1 hypothetical protein [Listeria portnoyi]